MNTDIKSLIPSMHAELKRMQSRVAELQVSLQQGSSDEKAIREEISRMNLRQVEIMDVMVEIQEYILGKQEAHLVCYLLQPPSQPPSQLPSLQSPPQLSQPPEQPPPSPLII